MQTTLFDVQPAVKAKLRGRPISAREWECLEAGLDEFNKQAGARLGALRGDGRLSDAGTRIGMRVREWPNLGPDDFREIVRLGFRRRWWKGRPSVGVVFGPGVFENLLGYRAAPAPVDEFDEYLASLDDDSIDSTAEEIQ